MFIISTHERGVPNNLILPLKMNEVPPMLLTEYLGSFRRNQR